MTTRFLLAGFGGQGILFAAKQLAACGMALEKQVSWLPSYGPEMRGGTCNCSVIISDDAIGSPLVNKPDVLIAFNLPSLDKFEGSIVPGGKVFIDSTMVNREVRRSDIEAHYIPATKLSMDNGLTGGANVIMLGFILAQTGIFDFDAFCDHLVSSIPASRAQLIENNKKALRLGFGYKA